MVVNRFGKDVDFMTKVNPSTQIAFGSNPKVALMGDYPTLYDIDTAYGKGFSTEWLIPQLVNLSQHSGAKNLSQQQICELANIISTEYRHLKITEILLFFYRFKNGSYGRFYGQVDPMVITCAFKEFMRERSAMLDKFYQEQEEEREREESKKPTVSLEQWLEMKEKENPNNKEHYDTIKKILSNRYTR